MLSVAALALATPIYGFALTPPRAMPLVLPDDALQITEVVQAIDDEVPIDPEVERQLEIRATMTDVMRVTGIGSWAAAAVSLALATIVFHDEYGFSSSVNSTPCARGTAIWQDYCDAPAWPHIIAAGTATALYVTSAALGIFMPDPLSFGDQPTERGERIRVHRTMRWITSSLLVLQAALAILVSNHELIGLDRQDDFDTLQAMSAVRLSLSAAAWVSLGVQGAVMLF